ncbi:hypothetical protein [Streptomyces sp. MUM 178J]|uniref:hypothetical protein n=1 Tax=Streptomyces sp. MUM 178J TaxID=2791991 RepID=UPI001F047A9A|nr:hypothetical protein [Streptomyces sp. MUM 178J]WRQ80374.1 hypothetical protein I3F59_014040 [Streptomyces sp. MUM 178J]
MTQSAALNVGLQDFLSWAEQERGTALPARTADAVLTLLALRGADRRAGVPEPTPQLLKQVLHDDAPVLLAAVQAELDALPDVLTALVDRVRAAGRLNAKRRARLLDAVDDLVPGARSAAASPWKLTWPRWYASLLRADGVDADDPDAVRAWLAAHDALPHADRPELPAPLHRADVTARTFAVRAWLTERLLAAFARDVEAPSPAGPLLPVTPALSADRPEDALTEELERIAATLVDRWSAAGLSEALAGPFAQLAPGPETMPHMALADRLLDEHLDYYGDSGVPLPPPQALPDPDEILGLLHAAPLPATLATGAADDEELRPLAEQCGFPGPADVVWESGTPEEALELAANVLALEADRIPAASAGPEAADEGYDLDAVHVLYALYERGGTPGSVARKASDMADWRVDPDLEDAPVDVPDTAAAYTAPYVTPAAADLSATLGIPGLTEDDRAELDAHARALAVVVDRLAETGCVFRTGDVYGLTSFGSAVLRYVLTAAHVAAPDLQTALSWNAEDTVRAAQAWPIAVAAAELGQWAEAHGGEPAWSQLLGALSAARGADLPHVATPAVFARLDRAEIPATALRAALADPVIGGYARRSLLARGEDAPEDAVPENARAVLLLEDLDRAWLADRRAQVTAGAGEGEPETPPRALLDAFDTAAATWPGGSAGLLRALAAAGAASALRVLTDLADRHPDPRVVSAAAHEAKSAETPARKRKRAR